jgi:hypothetical protein
MCLEAVVPRAVIALAGMCGCLIAGCGAQAHQGSRDLQVVSGCLRSSGFRVVGGWLGPATAGKSGAKAELTVQGGLFAFYQSPAAADTHYPAVAAAAEQGQGAATRRGTVILVTTQRGARDRALMHCLERVS